MVTVEASRKALAKLTGPLKELEGLLSDMGLELDGADGDALRIDVTPDRPDLVSTHGLARAIRAYKGLGSPTYATTPSSYVVTVDPSVAKVRPYTVCAVVKGLRFTDELIKEVIWVQEKLHATFGRHRKRSAIGIYPLEHVSFPITYKAVKSLRFRPLESSREMTAQEILRDHPAGKAYAHLLDGASAFPCFVDAKGDVLSMPPVINSERTGRVTTATTDVFIECSGHEFAALSQTLNIIVCLFADMGGQVCEVRVRYPDREVKTPLLAPEQRSLRVAYARSVTGVPFTAAQLKVLLERMGHRVTGSSKDTVRFEVPPYRTDVWHDIDVVDDVVRAYGINKLTPVLPLVAGTGGLRPATRRSRALASFLVGLGFQEVFTFSLTDKEDQYARMRLPEAEHVRLGRSAEQSLNMVRSWLLPEALKALAANRNREYPQLLFEIGDVVVPDETADVRCRNQERLVVVTCDAAADFTRAKRVADALARQLGLSVTYAPLDHPSFVPGRCAAVMAGKDRLGVLGEVHPEVLASFGLGVPVAALEWDKFKKDVVRGSR